MVSRVVRWLHCKSQVILVLMVSFSLVNLLSLLGRWEVFWGVLLGHLWFGNCVYSFVCGREIFFSAGARVGSESNIYVRVMVGGFSLLIYIILFFFRKY